MTFPFAPLGNLIIVDAEVIGPLGPANLILALDTGSTGTLIDPATLATVGFDLTRATGPVTLLMGGSRTSASQLVVPEITALGLVRRDFPVLLHALPPGAGINGLLGLDFLRGHVRTLDFRHGQITLK